MRKSYKNNEEHRCVRKQRCHLGNFLTSREITAYLKGYWESFLKIDKSWEMTVSALPLRGKFLILGNYCLHLDLRKFF